MKVTINGMEIERTIVALDKERAQVIVRWSNEDIPEGIRVAVDLPVEDGQTLSGEDLDRYLAGFCPISEFERRRALRSRLDLSHIEAMVEAPPVVPDGIGGEAPMQPIDIQAKYRIPPANLRTT